jgi:dTDP-D-glucose 4,6-dehydratase
MSVGMPYVRCQAASRWSEAALLLASEGLFCDDTPYDPSSPYSAAHTYEHAMRAHG